MLLSRFWYIFLAAVAAAAVGAALLAQGVINRTALEHVTDELHRDRLELDAIMRLEARARLDRIAFITVDSKLGGLLKQAAAIGDAKQLTKINSDAKEVLRSHVARLLEAAESDSKDKEADVKPDIVFAVDSAGRIIAQLGSLESNPPGTSLATYPFIERALRGYIRDDVIVYDRRVYRVAARPILFGGEYVGAIAHGYKFDDSFVQRMSKGLGGATVAFFYDHNVLASSTPAGAPALAEIAAALPDALGDARFKRGERTDPKSLQSGGRAIYSLVIGSAALSNVGYAVGRPLELIASPSALFQSASREDVQALPLPLLGGAAVLLAIFGLVFIYLERDRPYSQLRQKLAQIANGERERLIVTEWRGVYRKLADAVNQALEKSVEKAAEMAPSKKKANLDEILGPTPVSNVEPYFGFADAPGAPPKAPPARAEAPKAPPKPELPAKAPLKAPVPVETAKSPPPAPVQAPAPPPASAAKPIAAPPAVKATVANTNDSETEADHFREVYADYLSLRKECGESTDGLSYEKFENTLTKTRDQVLSKHPAKSVRFSVYIKEGKAALKAAPVKR